MDENEWMLQLQGVKSLEKRQEEIRKKKEAILEEKNIKEVNDFFQGPGEPAQAPVKDARGIPKPPVIPLNLFQPKIWLDVKLETVTRLQTKPKQMYTFVCGQEFRRDEFAWHSKAIHNDILGGMNNWLEHRCPLAVYGCGFSHRRLNPGPPRNKTRNRQKLIFSPAVESFGIQMLPDEVESSCQLVSKSKPKLKQANKSKLVKLSRDNIVNNSSSTRSRSRRSP